METWEIQLILQDSHFLSVGWQSVYFEGKIQYCSCHSVQDLMHGLAFEIFLCTFF